MAGGDSGTRAAKPAVTSQVPLPCRSPWVCEVTHEGLEPGDLLPVLWLVWWERCLLTHQVLKAGLACSWPLRLWQMWADVL